MTFYIRPIFLVFELGVYQNKPTHKLRKKKLNKSHDNEQYNDLL